MEQTEILRRMYVIRTELPECFSDPEIRPGEICIGYKPQEFLAFLLPDLVNYGIRCARVGDVAVMRTADLMGGFLGGFMEFEVELPHYPVFVMLRDVVLAEEATGHLIYSGSDDSQIENEEAGDVGETGQAERTETQGG